MAPRPHLNDWQIETIRMAYAESGNVAYAAKQAGVAYSPAYTYCRGHWPELHDLRKKMSEDIVRDLTLLRRLIIEELMTPARIKAASTTELMIMAGITIDKINNLEGNPTSRIAIAHEGQDMRYDATILTPEDRERAREVQRKLLNTTGRYKPIEERSVIEAAGSVV